MTPLPLDTHPDADRVQIDLLRRASPMRRAALCFGLSRWVAELSRRAIQEADPGIDDREAALRQLGLDHGPELERRVRAYLGQP